MPEDKEMPQAESNTIIQCHYIVGSSHWLKNIISLVDKVCPETTQKIYSTASGRSIGGAVTGAGARSASTASH